MIRSRQPTRFTWVSDCVAVGFRRASAELMTSPILTPTQNPVCIEEANITATTGHEWFGALFAGAVEALTNSESTSDARSEEDASDNSAADNGDTLAAPSTPGPAPIDPVTFVALVIPTPTGPLAQPTVPAGSGAGSQEQIGNIESPRSTGIASASEDPRAILRWSRAASLLLERWAGPGAHPRQSIERQPDETGALSNDVVRSELGPNQPFRTALEDHEPATKLHPDLPSEPDPGEALKTRIAQPTEVRADNAVPVQSPESDVTQVPEVVATDIPGTPATAIGPKTETDFPPKIAAKTQRPLKARSGSAPSVPENLPHSAVPFDAVASFTPTSDLRPASVPVLHVPAEDRAAVASESHAPTVTLTSPHQDLALPDSSSAQPGLQAGDIRHATLAPHGAEIRMRVHTEIGGDIEVRTTLEQGNVDATIVSARDLTRISPADIADLRDRLASHEMTLRDLDFRSGGVGTDSGARHDAPDQGSSTPTELIVLQDRTHSRTTVSTDLPLPATTHGGALSVRA